MSFVLIKTLTFATMKLSRGSILSAIMLLTGAIIYGAAWREERLYVPLQTVDLLTTHLPVRLPFRARSSEEYEIRFWFHVGNHSPEYVKRRLNIKLRDEKVRSSDVIDLTWRITLASGEPIATGSMQQPFSGYGDQQGAFAPLWPHLNLRGDQDYVLEVDFPREDEFIRSLRPTVALTIDRGGWTDIHPIFPIFYPLAKVILVFGLVSTAATTVRTLSRRRKGNEQITTWNAGKL